MMMMMMREREREREREVEVYFYIGYLVTISIQKNATRSNLATMMLVKIDMCISFSVIECKNKQLNWRKERFNGDNDTNSIRKCLFTNSDIISFMQSLRNILAWR
mgnify:CR=1 FL=1